MVIIYAVEKHCNTSSWGQELSVFFHSKNEPIFAVSMSNCNNGKSPLGSNHKI